MPVCPHQTAGMFLRRIVAIDQRNLVAMPHRAQGEQQVWPKDGGNSDQHFSDTTLNGYRLDRDNRGSRRH